MAQGGGRSEGHFAVSAITNEYPFSVTTTQESVDLEFVDPTLPYGPDEDLVCADIGFMQQQQQQQQQRQEQKSDLRTGSCTFTRLKAL